MKRLAWLLLLVAGSAYGQYTTTVASGVVAVPFAKLQAVRNGSLILCTGCNEGSFPCTAGAGNSFAFRIGGAWACPTISAAPAGGLNPDGSTVGATAQSQVFTNGISTAGTSIDTSGDIQIAGSAFLGLKSSAGKILRIFLGTGPSLARNLTITASWTAPHARTWLDADGTEVLQDATQTLTNKTITGLTATFGASNQGTCTLNGAATSTCTATVPATCTAPQCTYNSSATARVIACSTTATTLTAVSGTTLDSGVVNWFCP